MEKPPTLPLIQISLLSLTPYHGIAKHKQVAGSWCDIKFVIAKHVCVSVSFLRADPFASCFLLDASRRLGDKQSALCSRPLILSDRAPSTNTEGDIQQLEDI